MDMASQYALLLEALPSTPPTYKTLRELLRISRFFFSDTTTNQRKPSNLVTINSEAINTFLVNGT